MKPETELARALHRRDWHPGVNCPDCRTAGRALVHGRQRVPRARRADERAQTLRADQLVLEEHRGRIVQTPGHRGYLRHVQPEWTGVYVCTTSGVATYPPDTEFAVWGP